MSELDKLKRKLLVILFLTIILIAGALLYSVFSATEGEMLESVIVIVISIIMLIVTIFIFKKESKNVKDGYPLEDERSKQVKQKAAAYTYYLSIYYLLGLMWYNILAKNNSNIPYMNTEEVIGVGLGGIIILFFLVWFVLNKKVIKNET